MIHHRIVCFLILSTYLYTTGCETKSTVPSGVGNTGSAGQNGSEWLIPENDVLDGGPGKDGIPALTNPPRASVGNEAHDYLNDDDLVLGFSDGDQIVAFPHALLDWHEIINDNVGAASVAVTYCPLTGTGIGWDRNLEGSETTFGVSGLLYNSNLIPYDRKSDSYWSQIGLNCVNGDFRGKTARLHPIIEMTWRSWKELFPESMVVTRETGHSRNYGVYPYGGYKASESLIFPANNYDDRLHQKERVYAVLNEKTSSARVYRFEAFGQELSTINDVYFDRALVIIGKQDEFIIGYYTDIPGGPRLIFEPNGPASVKDQDGNVWNLFGKCISGPREGDQLRAATGFMGYWFAIAAFYPDPVIYTRMN